MSKRDYPEYLTFEDLLGKTLSKIIGGVGDAEMFFETETGELFKLFHEQD